jgi:hypothetical protein
MSEQAIELPEGTNLPEESTKESQEQALHYLIATMGMAREAAELVVRQSKGS